MSWHGSLTCSYCYERGHTRRKCPEMKRRHDEYEQLKKDGRGDEATYSQRMAHREYQSQQHNLKETNKSCAYCGKKGHRVGTCPDRLAVVQQLKELDEWFVPLARQTLTDMGIGVGSMPSFSTYVYGTYKDNVPIVVSEINARRSGQGGLSISNLWEHSWAQVRGTCLVDMREHNFVLPPVAIGRIWLATMDALGVKGWDLSGRTWDEPNKTLISEHDFLRWLSAPRWRGEEEESIVGTCSEPFPDADVFSWCFSKKREVNRLFRDSKNALLSERDARIVKAIHKSFKEKGVI